LNSSSSDSPSAVIGDPEDRAADSPPSPRSKIINPESSISPAASGSSHAQILRSSSIIGGATGINYILGMIRTKAVAVLLGPSGMGLVGLYVSITGLVSTIAQLGIDQSGVREVAEANGSGDMERVARVTKSLRRICWATGILGWILTATFAWPLSQWTFGTPDRIWPIAILGVTVLIGAVSGGQSALLQGMRRIGDLARIQVLSAVLNTVIAIGLYAWLHEEAIIPVIILTAIIQLGFSWHFARKVQITNLPQPWSETAATSKRLIGLGSAFMYGAVLAGLVGLAIRSMIVRDLGLEANGIYQAAWGLSGMFAGFILGAMGTDFYPRLAAVAHDNEQVNRLVNEQIEIGILLALPGLLATLTFAPWMMHLFYSAKFLEGASLLPWFLVGVLGQVLSWPLGMIQMAKAATKWIYFSRTSGNCLWFLLTLALITRFGIEGIGIAFAAYIWLQLLFVHYIAVRISCFRCTTGVMKLCGTAFVLVLACLYLTQLPIDWLKLPLCVSLTVGACIYCLRGITSRLGQHHKITKLTKKFLRF
jgi:enterobacterial common antigen flippase